jgi:hypothetical protein
MYTKGIILLSAWVLTGVIGNAQRNNSPIFDKWLSYKNEQLIKQGYDPNIFDLLGYTPPFVFFFEFIFALLCIVIFLLISILLRKQVPSKLKGVVLLLSITSVIYTIYVAIKDLIINIQWGFFTLLVQDVIWLVFAVGIIQTLWKNIRLKR